MEIGVEMESGFVSIMDPVESPYKERRRPAFFTDLNLDQVIDRISRDWGENVGKYYAYFPADAFCEDFRREVYGDVRREEVYEALCRFTERMKARREVFIKKGEVEQKLQRAVWHIREVDDYCSAFGELHEALENMELGSRGMRALRAYLGRYLAGEELAGMRSEAGELLQELMAFRLVLTYENDRIMVTQGETAGDYGAFLKGCFPGQNKRMKSPFEAVPELVELEQELLRVFQKKYPDFFQRAEAFYKRYEIYADEVLLRFASELGFYLSFCCFQRKMGERGFDFCTPTVAERMEDGRAGVWQGGSPESEDGGRQDGDRQKENGEKRRWGEDGGGTRNGTARPYMYAEGLYDLALACASLGDDRKVISNDMEYREEEGFFVLTGPNQGGKTTFARSLGQMVYLAKMGLEVPACRARLYRFTDLFTHFSVEESADTGRGKLMDELERLANMMVDSCRGAFVVINELFTTAANYDACIMGKRVLGHFLSRSCMGIYVTHLGELASAHPQVVSLRAMLDERGVQSFKIERGMAAEHANAASQVRQFGLTYEQLKGRLAGK